MPTNAKIFTMFMFFEAEHLIQAGNLSLLQSGTEKEAAAYVRTRQDGKEDYSLAAAWKSVLNSSAGIIPKGITNSSIIITSQQGKGSF